MASPTQRCRQMAEPSIYQTPRRKWACERNSDWTEGREIAHREANALANRQMAQVRHHARLEPTP